MKNKVFVRLTLLCCLVYFTSYITRINLAAALAEIIRDIGCDKTSAGIAITGSFITYGAGQIFSGFLGDRIKPRYMVAVGLLGSAACNIAVALLGNMYAISVIWCINGFFQSMMWPPLARILGENLEFTEYTKSCAIVTAASSAATIAVYLTVPLSIRISGWRLSFFWSAAFGVAAAIIWYASIVKISSAGETGEKKKAPIKKMRLGKVFASSGLYFVMAIIVLQGILRDGITTWMPTFIAENFDMGTSAAILTTVVLPVFSIICIALTSKLLTKLGSEFRVTLILWTVVFFSALVLALLHSGGIFVTVAMMSLITGSMYGINLMFIGNLPARFRKEGCISTVSGILNAFTYVGSAISAYGFAAVSEAFGWDILIISWCVMAAAAILLTFFAKRRWEH